jgi:hypothetical protein
MWKYTSILPKRHPLLASILVMGLASTVVACASTGSHSRYRFEVLDQPVPVSAHSTITVRVIDVSNGQPVDGATIPEAQLTMKMSSTVPPGKGIWHPDRSHSEQIRFVGSPGVGEYRFLGDVSMQGTWRLVLTALVPGESSPVEGVARFTASRERHDP